MPPVHPDVSVSVGVAVGGRVAVEVGAAVAAKVWVAEALGVGVPVAPLTTIST